MNTSPILDRPVQSLALPQNFPVQALLGQRGKIIKHIRDATGAKLTYVTEDHRIDIGGRPRSVQAAARLVEKTVEHFQYSGLNLAPKEIVNILAPELSSPGSFVQLVPVSRPVVTIGGTYDGFVCEPLPPGFNPGFIASAPPPSTARAVPVLQPATKREETLQRLLDLAVTMAVQHPARFEKLELRLYLGKLMACEVKSSARTVPLETLLTWTFPAAARMIFETSVPQETIRSLDSYLTSKGLVPTKQTKSASLHLESAIPWIQYHPTFSVQPDGSLHLSKLETLGCKPLTVSLVGPASQLDLRLRVVGSTEHREDEPVAADLRRLAAGGHFALVNGAQVVVPSDLKSLDLTLTSARVKLKRVYASTAPLRPPSAILPAAAAGAPAAAAPAKRTRAKRSTVATATETVAAAATATASPEAALPAVNLKVSVAAVVDNLGSKRLEVTAACPELNAAIMELHERREAGPEARERLAALMRAMMLQVEDIQRNVAFEP